MKIGNCGASEQIATESLKPKGASAAFGKEFKEVLEVEMTGLESTAGLEPKQLQEGGGIGPISQVLTINSTDSGGQGPPSLPEVDRIERALGKISAGLESGTAALGQIEDALKTLAKESESLRSFVESFPAGHPLARLGEELSVLSHVESIKWNRGDYV